MLTGQAPPIYVTVESSGVPTWVQITTLVIALLALAVSSLQFATNRIEQKRSRPNIKCEIVYGEKFYLGGPEPQRAVAVNVQNLGAEATKLNFLGVSTENSLVNGLNCLLDRTGKRIQSEEYARTIEPYSSAGFHVDASMIDADEVHVTASFGHGVVARADVGRDKSRMAIIEYPRRAIKWYAPWRRLNTKDVSQLRVSFRGKKAS